MTNAALKIPLPFSVSFEKPKIVCDQPKSDRSEQKYQNNNSVRSRGVVLTLNGWNKLQTAKTQAEFQENAGDRFTLEELSERTALSLATVSKVLGRLEPVDRSSLQAVFHSFSLELTKSDYSRPNSAFQEQKTQHRNFKQDWGEAMDVRLFCGRETEVTTLRQWVLEEHCRLLTVLGMGGIGKSSLVVKLASQIKSAFEVVVWRSLQNAPPLEELLESILPSLLHTQGGDFLLPASLDQKMAIFMNCLRSSRCLLVLDNLEAILANRDQSGRFRAGCENYGQLIQHIGAASHQSCAILTSCEKPQPIAFLEGEELPVRSFQLGALKPIEGRSLVEHKGKFIGSETQRNALIEHYSGQPLALRVVAVALQEIFNGEITEILKYVEQGFLVFDEIREGFDRQFERLSPLEQEVMLWLAIHQKPVSLKEVEESLVSTTSQRNLPGALNSLLRRSLIEHFPQSTEQNLTQFGLQSIVMKYVLERLIRQVCHEIEQRQVSLLRTHALFNESNEKTQKGLILKQVTDWLLTAADKSQQQWLEELLEQQKQIS